MRLPSGVRAFLVLATVYGLTLGAALHLVPAPGTTTPGDGPPAVGPGNPGGDPATSLGIAVATVTVAILFFIALYAINRYGATRLWTLLILLYVGGAVLGVLAEVLPTNLLLVAPVVAIVLVAVLAITPRWGLVNLAAILTGIHILTTAGTQYGLATFVAIALLLAVWDAFAVFVTGWMVELGKHAAASRLPVLLVLPVTREQLPILVEPPADDPTDDDALAFEPSASTNVLMLGLGDVIIPGLVAVAALRLPGALPVAGATVGTLLGLAVLAALLAGNERALPALPVLSVATVAGLLVGGVLAGLTAAQAVGLAPVPDPIALG